ncbi:Rieske (2Fe-2S) protein [Bradyrhizobium sp. SZCCHNPS1003]|uniref:Rieske (2Fe-2S) protein n=1 Tax=Bradyrhizobium sp. SZCCHNPS1003 TaxID=3057330 RepID=UPI0028EA3D86|nr:Rieske 2Fe-2S domain-containing protein [Bradyrhizobium sp. SZCCHNPS1003]
MATTREAGPHWLRLCRADEIGEAQSRGFDPDDDGQDSLFVVRWQGQLHGWRNACPHVDGAPMAWRRDAYLNAEGTRIVCHAHGAEFMPDTGLCVQGPCRGEQLSRIELVVADDELFVKS